MGNKVNTLAYNLYDNIELYHPEGKLMCFLNSRRANWYRRKGLVKQIAENKFQLLFNPKGAGEPLDILEPRMNICAVNGDTTGLTKHHVVPTQFRKHFRLKYKDKNCFDLVLLGREIHDEYELHATILKDKLFNTYVSPDIKEFYYDFIIARNLNGIKLRHFKKVPVERQIFITMKLEGIMERWNLSDVDLLQKSPYHIHNYNKKIVEELGEELLIIMWKHHFIKWASPKYLPSWWKPNLFKINKRGSDSEVFYYEMTEETKQILIKYDCI